MRLAAGRAEPHSAKRQTDLACSSCRGAVRPIHACSKNPCDHESRVEKCGGIPFSGGSSPLHTKTWVEPPDFPILCGLGAGFSANPPPRVSRRQFFALRQDGTGAARESVDTKKTTVRQDGFWWAHAGWLLDQKGTWMRADKNNASDLASDRESRTNARNADRIMGPAMPELTLASWHQSICPSTIRRMDSYIYGAGSIVMQGKMRE